MIENFSYNIVILSVSYVKRAVAACVKAKQRVIISCSRVAASGFAAQIIVTNRIDNVDDEVSGFFEVCDYIHI